MRWPGRKWVRSLLVALATGFLFAIVLATWIVTTESGLRRAVLFVESLDAVKIQVQGASGRLIGPLAVASIEIDHPRATIRITGFKADYEPLELLAGRISAEGVGISDATIRLRPPSGGPSGRQHRRSVYASALPAGRSPARAAGCTRAIRSRSTSTPPGRYQTIVASLASCTPSATWIAC